MVESIHIREIAASDILAKIERGEPVEYSDIIVYGDLDVGKLNLKKENEKVIIGSSIKIDNSRINGSTAS